jgi:hypothetical protein
MAKFYILFVLALCALLLYDDLAAHAPPYDRAAFPHWVDSDSDCQNTRHETLIRDNLGTLTYTANTCLVLYGMWRCPYTDKVFLRARDLDVDHVIPLAHAWTHGASDWPEAKRLLFANDSANLLAVSASANRTKGAKAPHAYMPPNTGYHCAYLERWLALKHTYSLLLSPDEAAFIYANLQTCP